MTICLDCYTSHDTTRCPAITAAVICQTCREHDATHVASLYHDEVEGRWERWRVCGRCMAQAQRLNIHITYQEITRT